MDFVLLSQPEFQLFGLAHCLAMLVTLFLAIGLTRFAKSNPDEKVLKRLRYTMAVLLVTAVALDPILTLRRYGMGEFGWGLVVDSSLPLYLCDVV